MSDAPRPVTAKPVTATNVTATPVKSPVTDPDGAATYLAITKRHLEELVYRREIPVHKVGQLNRFAFKDLDKYLRDHRIEAAS